MEIRRSSVHFPRMHGSGPRTSTASFNFARSVQNAVAGLVGISGGFRGDDHNLGIMEVNLSTAIDDDVVSVAVTFGLRDWSGNWDDDYEGTVQFVVLADLVPASDPRPRGDLSIQGMELTQAVQSFRSAQHLSAIHARVDNSIPLIARKDTGIRLYVDYDSASGLPSISALSGVVEVLTSIGSTIFQLAPAATVVPRRDINIDRGQVSHTLNFRIPEGWCQGELRLRARAFDAADPNQRSGVFERSIQFLEREPLRVYGVGVNYTGQGLNLAAPTVADFANTMEYTEITYPVPEVFLTGFDTIVFAVDMQANIQDGCGDGFSELLDRLSDMRGDSTDIYYALLPTGVNSGSVGGCGRSGVGAGFINNGPTAAHEIGHAFDRRHAPCDSSTRCDSPARQDDDYPAYDGLASDSIGEYGYDPVANTVFSPASTYDFMGYSWPRWVSPYTYLGLMSKFPAMDGPSGLTSPLKVLRAAIAPYHSPKQGEEDGEWIRKKMMTLFLRLSIDRERRVILDPSFHFPALSSRPVGHPTEFTVELADEKGRVLSCQPLVDICSHCRPPCWPRSFRQPVPFPRGTRILTIWEGDEVVHQEEVRDAPTVKVKSRYDRATERFGLEWEVAGPEVEGADYWYLVQWEDDDGTWRGLEPRTRDPWAHIPLKLFRRRREMRVRVLATSGIATGIAEKLLKVEEPPAEKLTVILAEGDRSSLASGMLGLTVVDATGRSVPDAEAIWHDDSGVEVGRGRSLDLRQLSLGEHVLHATVLNQGSGQADAAWLVERREGEMFAVHFRRGESKSEEHSDRERERDHGDDLTETKE